MATWGKNKTKEKQWFHTVAVLKYPTLQQQANKLAMTMARFYGYFTPLWRLHGGYLIILFYNS